jgi:hypothetical protein
LRKINLDQDSKAKISTNETTTKDETTNNACLDSKAKTSKDETQELSTPSLQPVKTENLINLNDLNDLVKVTNYNEKNYKQELKGYKNRNPFINVKNEMKY